MSGRDEPVLESRENMNPVNWSADGRHLLYKTLGPTTGAGRAGENVDLWALPLDGERMPFPVATDPAVRENNGQFSPDGRWVAYESDASGRHEIWVQSFPDGRVRQRVSIDGGQYARWRRDDGRELFYLAPGGRLMAVELQPAPGGDRLEIGTPVELFVTPLLSNLEDPVGRQPYVVSPDGQRFLITIVKETGLPLTMILNWQPPQP